MLRRQAFRVSYTSLMAMVGRLSELWKVSLCLGKGYVVTLLSIERQTDHRNRSRNRSRHDRRNRAAMLLLLQGLTVDQQQQCLLAITPRQLMNRNGLVKGSGQLPRV